MQYTNRWRNVEKPAENMRKNYGNLRSYYLYVLEHCKIVAVDLSKQQVLNC